MCAEVFVLYFYVNTNAIYDIYAHVHAEKWIVIVKHRCSVAYFIIAYRLKPKIFFKSLALANKTKAFHCDHEKYK